MTIEFTVTREKDLEAIVDHYGIQNQLCKVQKEAEELNLVLDDPMYNRIRNLSRYRTEMIDELADVAIMASQSLIIVELLRVKHNFSYPELIERVHFKIDRTLNRIEDELIEHAQEGWTYSQRNTGE